MQNKNSKLKSFIFYAVVFSFALFVFNLAMPAPAQAKLTLSPDCKAELAPSDPKACNITAFIAWIHQVIRFLLAVAIPLGILFIVYGAFVIITAGGSEDKVKKGKDIILASVIGLAIALSAWLIVTTVKNILLGGI